VPALAAATTTSNQGTAMPKLIAFELPSEQLALESALKCCQPAAFSLAAESKG
jgi:hypothetical protein